MSSRASQWPCPQPLTTASTKWRLVQSTTDRRRTGPGRLRTKLCGNRSPKQPGKRCSSSCLTKTPRGCGPGFSLSLGRKNGFQRQVVHITDLVRVTPMVQILDAPVPQTVEQLQDIMLFFDTLPPIPEQVIEVSKILLDDVPTRAVLRDTQLVEQLVEVPTIVPYSSLSLLQVLMEQNVGVPVVGGSGAGGGLPGFSPRTELFYDCRADRLQSSSSAGWCWRSSRFTPWTEFNHVFGADRRVSRSRWRSSKFSASPGLRSVFFGFSWTSW